MDFKTTVWFIAKFDENIRLDIVNYAFENIQIAKEQEIAIVRKEAKKPKKYKDGTAGLRRCLLDEYEDDEELPSENEAWSALIWKGAIKTKAKVTIIRRFIPSFEGIIGSSKKYGMPTFKPNMIRQIITEWREAGEPKQDEYERLAKEFSDISKDYRAKLEALKQNDLE